MLVLALLPACAGGAAGDGGSPFAEGGSGPVAHETGSTGAPEVGETSSEGANESSTTHAIEDEMGSSSGAVASDDTSGGSAECLPTTGDCDGDGLCEADLEQPETCGACEKSCVLPGATLACNAGTCEGVVTLTAVADAYIDDDEDDTNYGSAGHLVIVDDADVDVALVKPTDLGGIPVGATVMHAELVLASSVAGSPITVSAVASAWDEATVTWNTRPSAATTLATHPVVLGANAIAITAIAQAWVDAGVAEGVQLAPTGEAETVLASRESSAANDRPHFALTIVY